MNIFIFHKKGNDADKKYKKVRNSLVNTQFTRRKIIKEFEYVCSGYYHQRYGKNQTEIIFFYIFNHINFKNKYLKQSEYFFYIICYLKLMIKHFKEKFIKKTIIYKLYRYLIFNVQILNLKEKVIRKFNIMKNKDYYISNTFFSSNKERENVSINAINFFFDEVDSLNLGKKNIYFIVDGRFYGNKNIENSYSFIMREYFLKKCELKNYNCIDMKKHFDMHYKINQKRFSFERDNHRNKIAHELVGKKLSEKFQKVNLD